MFAEEQVASECRYAIMVKNMNILQHLLCFASKSVQCCGVNFLKVVINGISIKVVKRCSVHTCCIWLIATRVLE